LEVVFRGRQASGPLRKRAWKCDNGNRGRGKRPQNQRGESRSRDPRSGTHGVPGRVYPPAVGLEFHFRRHARCPAKTVSSSRKGSRVRTRRLGCACLRANERLDPLAVADVPTLAPELGQVDTFTLELVAWRGHDGENEGSRTLTPRQSGVIRRAWELKGAVA